MIPKSRSNALIGAAFALTAPFVAFVVYFALRLPQNQWPSWFTNTIAIWFVANFVILTMIAKRIFKKKVVEETQGEVRPAVKTKRSVWIVRIVCSYLVIVWTVLFFIGVKDTIEGEYVLSRAIPAGAFLLFFIGLFSWTVYRSFQKKA